MIEDRLQLPVGTSIQLHQENVDTPIRYTVKLLGYYPGKGLIVTNTEHNGRTVLLTDDTPLVCRALQGSSVQGFRVKVIQTSMMPYPHIHLSYPEDIETSIIRDARRIITKQPALVRNSRSGESRSYEAMIVDLSASGAKIATRVPVADVNEILEIKMVLDVADSEETLNLLGEVKSVDFREGNRAKARLPLHYYGLMFKGVNRYQKLALHAFVMEVSMKVEM